ncbi:cytochrome P450 [Antribacter gilvus]|uniref:cytochrome P450 n=1 Tax=Antribacter gilvus TaxID=2304675 RepID=UPI001F0C98DE|nr:cytochrome P450 [Antribacter gilvus]
MSTETLPPYPFPMRSALEPPEQWAELRAQCPVAHVRLASGDSATLLTRYDDVRAVLSDPRFTRQLDAAAGAARVTANESGGVFASSADQMGVLDSRESHQQWRRLVGATFTAKRVQALAPGMLAKAEELLDGLTAADGPVDLVSAFNFPLPIWVICELLGVPESDRSSFGHWSDTMMSLSRFTQAEIDTAQADFAGYLGGLVASKRETPGDDLVSALIALVDAADPRVTEPMVIATARGLLVAGHETTANMIGKMLAMLLSDRSRWEALVADRSLVRNAVEEVLRFDANAGFGLPRFISEDLELPDSTTIPAGTTVVVSMASANRDEEAFAAADSMDLTRSPNPHLAFGAGPHSCMGQALARTELQVVLEVLLDRLPALELAVDPAMLRTREDMLVGGLVELPVRW